MSRVYFFFFLMYNKSITGGILEEKLYFRPANYGKGLKKHKEKPVKTEKQTDNKEDHRVLKLGSFLFFLAIIVIITIWLLRGRTTTSGQYPENVKNESLVCSSDTLTYSKINTASSEDRELKITSIFNSSDKLKSISVAYTLTFKNEEESYAAEISSNIEFVEGLATLGYNSSKFSNKFSRYNNKLIISLSANTSELDETSKSYFMLDPKYEINSIIDYRDYFESLGLNCKSN